MPIVFALATVLGCGSDGEQQEFTAASFIRAAKAEDAGIELGGRLPFAREGVEEHSLRFQGTGPAAASAGGETPTDVHGAGTLAVFEDDAGAVAEYQRCEAADLICYQTDNVALTFSGTVNPADLDRLTVALQELAGE
jgi:hypothetical protein